MTKLNPAITFRYLAHTFLRGFHNVGNMVNPIYRNIIAKGGHKEKFSTYGSQIPSATPLVFCK